MSYRESRHIVYFEKEPKMFIFLLSFFLFATTYLIYSIIKLFRCKYINKEKFFDFNEKSDFIEYYYICSKCEEAYEIKDFDFKQRCFKCDGVLKPLEGFYDNWEEKIDEEIVEEKEEIKKEKKKKRVYDEWWEID
jgi:hypothetical protein